MLRIVLALAALPPLVATAFPSASAPCLRPVKPGTRVQGEVRVCPGRWRVADPREEGVLVVSAPGTRLDLRGVTLESGDTASGRLVGVGVAARGVDAVEIVGGTIRGYRHGVRLEGGARHRVAGSDLSGAGRDADGAGLVLRGVREATVTDVTARGGAYGVVLAGTGRTLLARIAAGRAASAGIVLREGSDSNVVVDSDVRYSGVGVLLAGAPSSGNLVARNDAAGASRSAFEAAAGWSNSFLDNRADSSLVGFRLDGATATTLRGNTIVGTREAAVTIAHGGDNAVAQNTIIGGGDGIRLSAPRAGAPPSRGYRVDDNVLALVARGLVLERSTRVRARGNVFDGVGAGLVADSVSAAGAEVRGNVFLRAEGAYVAAPGLDAGGNYWGAADSTATRAKLRGRILLDPWRSAREAGF